MTEKQVKAFLVPSYTKIDLSKQDHGTFIGKHCCHMLFGNHGNFTFGDWTTFRGGDNVFIQTGIFISIDLGKLCVAILGQGSKFRGKDGCIIKYVIGDLIQIFHINQMLNVKADTWYRLSPDDRKTLEELDDDGRPRPLEGPLEGC